MDYRYSKWKSGKDTFGRWCELYRLILHHKQIVASLWNQFNEAKHNFEITVLTVGETLYYIYMELPLFT